MGYPVDTETDIVKCHWLLNEEEYYSEDYCTSNLNGLHSMLSSMLNVITFIYLIIS